jgi:hypothetical protein
MVCLHQLGTSTIVFLEKIEKCLDTTLKAASTPRTAFLISILTIDKRCV